MTTAVRTEHPHVVCDASISGGEPIIAGTRIGVAFVARYLQQGVAPEQILELYPHLTPAGLYDAISYYFDHEDEIGRIIAASTPEQVQKRVGYSRGAKGLITFKGR